jgi:LmbE family N-acetylglucosaminyl deacetylase
MKAHEFFALADRLPLADLSVPLGGGGALVIAPHPDDESLGCGALIASAVAEGRQTRVITLSDGAGSHPTSEIYPPARLRALREDEARAAAATLGLGAEHLFFLALPDRRVPFAGPSAARAAAIIATTARAAGASALFVTWRYDPHCDHQAAYAIAREAQKQSPFLRLFEYSIWGRAFPLAREPTSAPQGWRFDAAAQRARKRAAIACHRSQVSDLIRDDPRGFRLDVDMVTAIENRDEIFLEMDP